MAIRWTDDLATGVSDIDAQHKELFNQINTLSTAMSEGKGKTEITKIIDFLGQYTVEHFSTEERKMAACKYPKSSAHKALHEAFIETFKQLRNDLQTHGATSSLVIDVNLKVGQWLRTHIADVDKQLGTFLQN